MTPATISTGPRCWPNDSPRPTPTCCVGAGHVHPHPDGGRKRMPCVAPATVNAAPNGRINATATVIANSTPGQEPWIWAILKLRHDSYFPDSLLERRKRAERALTTEVATCYLLGVSTRRMDRLVEALGITSLSKSQVSVMAIELDTAVEAFRILDAGPYTFMAADALVVKVREQGRVVNVHALIAVGVTPRATARCSRSTSPPPRTGPAG
jgi:Transposase, Mutator family